MQLVVYIDDILLMAESKERAQPQAYSLMYLLTCLGFTLINVDKTITEQTQVLNFTMDTEAI